MMERTFRRVQMMLGRGRVTLIDDSGPVQVMQVQSNAHEISDKRIRVTEFGFSSVPPLGSDVLTSHLGGDRTSGAVYATNHQQSRPRGLQHGESMLYSEDGKSIYMTAGGGIVIDANGQDVVVNNAQHVTVNATIVKIVATTSTEIDTPLLKVSGDILDNSATNTTTIAGMRADYNTHLHSGVVSGSGNSGTPNNSM